MGKKRVSKAAVPPPPVDPVPEQDQDEIVDEAVLSPSRTNEIISPVHCAVLGLDTGRVKSSLSFTASGTFVLCGKQQSFEYQWVIIWRVQPSRPPSRGERERH